MAIEWHYVNNYLAFGVEWNAASYDTYATIAPVVYRWDRYDTVNSGGRLGESLSPDTGGSGSWSGISMGSGSGERVLDTFATRTYERGASAYTVSLTLSWNSSTGSAWGGYFHTTGAGSNTWTLSIDAMAYRAPYAPDDVSAARVSDTKNTVAWSQSGTGMNGLYPWSGFFIERQADSGAWSRIATVTSWEATSYDDATTSANHAYRYRVLAYGPGGTSEASDETAALYNTPCAPSFLKVERTAETTITATLDNDANTASALEVERSSDKSSWDSVGTFDGKVTSFSDTPGGGTFYYRARNTRGSLKSEWAYSDAVVTMCAPAAPTLRAPTSGSTVRLDQSVVTVSWLHNAIDGSAQTAAQVAFSTDGGSTWEVEQTGSAQTLDLLNTFPVNATVTLRVRTKGAHDDWGPWSGNRVFYVRQVPTVVIEEPAYGFVVENIPIHVRASYADASGELAAARLFVERGGVSVFERDMGTSLELDISQSEFVPEDGSTYTIVVQVRSSSSLTAVATRDVSVDFTPPAPAVLSVDADADEGLVSVLVGIDGSEGFEEPVSASVYRVSESGRVLLGGGLSAGACVVDRYAPVNVPYSYEAVTVAASGAVNVVTFDTVLSTPWWFMYFGDDTAKGMWNPSYSFRKSRPSKVREYFAGRMWPVSYDDLRHTSQEGTVSLLLMERAERAAFDRLVESGGRCVFKSGDGDVFLADADVEFSPATVEQGYWGTVSVSLSRIDGGVL